MKPQNKEQIQALLFFPKSWIIIYKEYKEWENKHVELYSNQNAQRRT